MPAAARSDIQDTGVFQGDSSRIAYVRSRWRKVPSPPAARAESELEQLFDECGGRNLVEDARVAGNDLTRWADKYGKG